MSLLWSATASAPTRFDAQGAGHGVGGDAVVAGEHEYVDDLLTERPDSLGGRALLGPGGKCLALATAFSLSPMGGAGADGSS